MAKDAIRCPRCHCGESKVRITKSEPISFLGKEKIIIRRTRECMRCHQSWTTREIPDEIVNQLLPGKEDQKTIINTGLILPLQNDD